jgi:nicotinate-nucleotide adenylyltransferase
VKTGLLGGTFDPPHLGHLIIAQDAALALALDRVLFVPAAIPPHKRGRSITPGPVRAEMLALATAADPRFGIDTLEIERGGASWTVDTLRALHERDGATEWTLLLGADQYAEFETWREPAAIRSLARIAVLTRGGRGGTGHAEDRDAAVPLAATPLADGAFGVNVSRIDISSTEIRRRVADGLPIRYLVPDAVAKFIFEKKLYVRNGTPQAG